MKRFLCNRLIFLSALSVISTIACAETDESNMIDLLAPNQPAQQQAAHTPVSEPSLDIASEQSQRNILYSVTQDDYTWKKGPASFPKGSMYTVLEGDPFSDGPYTIRVKLPPHYRLPAHAHQDNEAVTVISGVLNIALGDQLKEGDGVKLPAGGFTVLTPKVNHFEWTGDEGAVIQIQGLGPRTSMYVDKNNDPTWRKTLQAQPVVANGSSHRLDSAVSSALGDAVAMTADKTAVKLAQHQSKSILAKATHSPHHRVMANALSETVKSLSQTAGVTLSQHSYKHTFSVASTKSIKPIVQHSIVQNSKKHSLSSQHVITQAGNTKPHKKKYAASVLTQRADILSHAEGLAVAHLTNKHMFDAASMQSNKKLTRTAVNKKSVTHHESQTSASNVQHIKMINAHDAKPRLSEKIVHEQAIKPVKKPILHASLTKDKPKKVDDVLSKNSVVNSEEASDTKTQNNAAGSAEHKNRFEDS